MDSTTVMSDAEDWEDTMTNTEMQKIRQQMEGLETMYSGQTLIMYTYPSLLIVYIYHSKLIMYMYHDYTHHIDVSYHTYHAHVS